MKTTIMTNRLLTTSSIRVFDQQFRHNGSQASVQYSAGVTVKTKIEGKRERLRRWLKKIRDLWTRRRPPKTWAWQL